MRDSLIMSLTADKKGKVRSTASGPRTFKAERTLQKYLERFDFSVDRNTSVSYTRREVPVGEVVPDLIQIVFRSRPLLRVWPKRWSYRHACVVAALRRQPRTIPQLAEILYERVHSLEALIDDLKRAGTVKQDAAGVVRLDPAIQDPNGYVVAVEAKLQRWRDALSQAIAYRRFADITVVVLGSAAGVTADTIDVFAREGIGLCVVEEKGLRWHVRPTSSCGLSPEREYLLYGAASPHRPWSRRYPKKASRQART